MKVGIVHGAGINPDGSLQPHTKARADLAIKVVNNSTVDRLIVCGKNEADPIASYILNKGIDEEKITIENLSYSTLSNLYYCKMLLSFLNSIEPIKKVYLISNYWHIPRLSFDTEKILGNEYQTECLSAMDPRDEKEIRKSERWEKLKFISDMMLLKLGYGKEFDRTKFLGYTFLGLCIIRDGFPLLPTSPREIIEKSMEFAIPSHQRRLMKLEKMLYAAMKIV